MYDILTQRLRIIPCSLKVAQAILMDKKYIEELLGVSIPANWPLEDLEGYLPNYMNQLVCDSYVLGWGIWLVIHRKDNRVIGDIGFLGIPDDQGIIEIGYSVIPEYRKQGYAFEGTEALIQGAFRQRAVTRVIAHCYQENMASIKLLEKLGMTKVMHVDNIIKWELKKGY